MQLSDRFLSLVHQQLRSFRADVPVARLVVYVAQPRTGQAPSLEAVGEWPEQINSLPPVEADPELRTPSQVRRWYPLQEGEILLGVLRAELPSSIEGWPESLDNHLQVTALVLTYSLSLEIERNKLLEEITDQQEQIRLMVHQLRNPLAAIRTYTELLMRRLGPESNHRNLVQGMLTEQAQLNTYISAIDQLGLSKQRISQGSPVPLLLPPWLPKNQDLNMKALLMPLIERSAVTSSLQGREWIGPSCWPLWTDQTPNVWDGSVAEIVANLLENAFRYSSPQRPIGLCLKEDGLIVWDGGDPIRGDEREMIFERGFRGQKSKKLAGSGLGLALARQLAESLDGSLELIIPPSSLDADLPNEGNAFLLKLPSTKLPS